VDHAGMAACRARSTLHTRSSSLPFAAIWRALSRPLGRFSGFFCYHAYLRPLYGFGTASSPSSAKSASTNATASKGAAQPGLFCNGSALQAWHGAQLAHRRGEESFAQHLAHPGGVGKSQAAPASRCCASAPYHAARERCRPARVSPSKRRPAAAPPEPARPGPRSRSATPKWLRRMRRTRREPGLQACSCGGRAIWQPVPPVPSLTQCPPAQSSRRCSPPSCAA